MLPFGAVSISNVNKSSPAPRASSAYRKSRDALLVFLFKKENPADLIEIGGAHHLLVNPW